MTGIPRILLFFACTIMLYSALSGQDIRVSEPVLEMQGSTIYITYDILNSSPSEKFTVELVVKDEDGMQINAAALSGDVGELVTGGDNKQIKWNLELDRIEMNADIYVMVYVKAIPPNVPVAVLPEEKEDEKAEEEVEENPPDESVKEADIKTGVASPVGSQYSRTGLVLQSAAFPGLGLSRYKGGPHWIKGALGYGCLAGSVIMNWTAVKTFDGIIDQPGYDAKNIEYQKALQQDQVSEVLAYAALAIWVSDLVWTIVGTSDLTKRSARNEA